MCDVFVTYSVTFSATFSTSCSPDDRRAGVPIGPFTEGGATESFRKWVSSHLWGFRGGTFQKRTRVTDLPTTETNNTRDPSVVRRRLPAPGG